MNGEQKREDISINLSFIKEAEGSLLQIEPKNFLYADRAPDFPGDSNIELTIAVKQGF